jgi:tRNA-specific 2-thiouridylase
MEKSQVRQLAQDFELHSMAHKAESQDLCFIPDGDTAGFLGKHLPALQPGEIVDSSGEVVGQHKGLGYYTIGQRRGLGIATGKPRYVLELNLASNQLLVGDEEELEHSRMLVDELSWLQPGPHLRAGVKYRSTTAEAPADLEDHGETLRVRFHQPQRALAPGQAAVFYDGEEVLGGGTIAEILAN